jgi:transposase
MPRRPLEEINTNSRRGTELSPYVRSKVATLRAEGITISEIADRVKISENNVKWTVKLDLQHNNSITLKRSGRPKKYTERDKRQIIHFIQVYLKSIYVDIRQNL